MSEDPQLSELEKHRRFLCGLLARQVRLIDFAIHDLAQREGLESREREEIDTILLMIQGMGVSAHSILKLTQTVDMAIRDCYGIARSVVETGINVAYIVAGGADIVQRARRHAEQKNFRDLNRAGEFGPIAFKLAQSGPLPDPRSIPGLQEALDEFSDKKGRELRNWTTDNIDSRLRIIEEKFDGTALNFAGPLALVYRHSSEILHGTFFGIVYCWTAGSRRPSNRAEAEWILLSSHLVSVISATLFAIRGVIEVLERRYEIAHLQKENKEILKLLTEYVEEHLTDLTPEQLTGHV